LDSICVGKREKLDPKATCVVMIYNDSSTREYFPTIRNKLEISTATWIYFRNIMLHEIELDPKTTVMQRAMPPHAGIFWWQNQGSLLFSPFSPSQAG
jgi:hypothetical protein